jgi:hypothetical protein
LETEIGVAHLYAEVIGSEGKKAWVGPSIGLAVYEVEKVGVRIIG